MNADGEDHVGALQRSSKGTPIKKAVDVDTALAEGLQRLLGTDSPANL